MTNEDKEAGVECKFAFCSFTLNEPSIKARTVYSVTVAATVDNSRKLSSPSVPVTVANYPGDFYEYSPNSTFDSLSFTWLTNRDVENLLFVSFYVKRVSYSYTSHYYYLKHYAIYFLSFSAE